MPPSRRDPRPDAPYRIKDLIRMTGVSKETIRFYINEGLLPPPVKTAHNMGWYSDRHVELLGLISELQSERYLPLKAIRLLLQGHDGLALSESQRQAFEGMRRRITADHRELVVSDDAAKLARDMGLSRREQKELLELGLAAGGKVTMSDIEIARQWIAIRDAGLSLERGFSPRDLRYMQDVVEFALRAEIDIFLRRIDSIPDDDAGRVIDVVIPALSRLFALLHERSVRAFAESLALRKRVPPPGKPQPRAAAAAKPRAPARNRGNAATPAKASRPRRVPVDG